MKFSYLSGEKLWNLRRRLRRRRRRRLRHVFPAQFRLSAGVKSQVFHGRNIVCQRRGRNVREPTEEWGGEEGERGVDVGVRWWWWWWCLKETPPIQGPPVLFGYKVQCEPAQPLLVTPSLNEVVGVFCRCGLITHLPTYFKMRQRQAALVITSSKEMPHEKSNSLSLCVSYLHTHTHSLSLSHTYKVRWNYKINR